MIIHLIRRSFIIYNIGVGGGVGVHLLFTFVKFFLSVHCFCELDHFSFVSFVKGQIILSQYMLISSLVFIICNLFFFVFLKGLIEYLMKFDCFFSLLFSLFQYYINVYGISSHLVYV